MAFVLTLASGVTIGATDFSEFDIGAGVPSGLTRFGDPAPVFSVADDADPEIGRYVQIVDEAFKFTGFGIDAFDGIFSEGELLILCYIDTNTENRSHGGPALALSGTTNVTIDYLAAKLGKELDSQGGQYRLFIELTQDGSGGTLAQTETALSPSSTGWFWVRFRLTDQGGAVAPRGQAKIWLHGTTEPVAWLIDRDLSALVGVEPAGVIGFAAHALHESPLRCAYFAFTTDPTLEGPPTEVESPFSLGGEAESETWVFDVGRFQSRNEVIWHKNVRNFERPAIVAEKDLYYVNENDEVIQLDRSGSLVAGGYWVSPMLNRPNTQAEYTLAKVMIRYECAFATTLTIEASGDGGLTWQAGFTATVPVLKTEGKIARVAQGFNISGPDLRFRVSLTSDSLVLLRSWRAEIIERSDITWESE